MALIDNRCGTSIGNTQLRWPAPICLLSMQPASHSWSLRIKDRPGHDTCTQRPMLPPSITTTEARPGSLDKSDVRAHACSDAPNLARIRRSGKFREAWSVPAPVSHRRVEPARLQVHAGNTTGPGPAIRSNPMPIFARGSLARMASP
jgi:hypothetical protein